MLHAVIPLKDPARGKSRLRAVLSADERARLSVTMLAEVATCLLAVRAIRAVHVVTPQEANVPRGCRFIADRGGGLNAALGQAAAVLSAQGATALLVCAADVPSVSPADVRELIELSHTTAVVAATDWHGEGTNALLMTPADAIAPRFGRASLAAHAAAAQRAGRSFRGLSRPGLAHDIDAPDQLPELLRRDAARYGFLRAALERHGARRVR